MNLTESLQNKINDLYNDTPENIHGVGLGYKYINNQKTETIGIIFTVYKKKSLSELTQDEILPNSIEVNNISYVTDVIEETSIPSALACYSSTTTIDPEILRLRGDPSFLFPIKGGQEILRYPHDWVASADDGGWSIIMGTLGLLAIDNHDNNIVGITNAHVACSNPFIASDRTGSELVDPYNIIEPTPWALLGNPSIKFEPGLLCFNVPESVFFSSPRIKRYQPIRKQATNTVDCAVMFLTNDTIMSPDNIVTNNSFGIHAPSTEPVSSLKPPFATTADLNSLLTTNPFLFSTGRTTGPKGWGQTSSCRLVITGVGKSASIDFHTTASIPFSNLIEYKYEDGSARPSDEGDSGSAVLANIDGTVKVIGLLFAGDTTKAYLCRIDEIVQKLNIRAWGDDYVFNASAPCGNPYTDLSQPAPVNPTLSQIVVCDFNDARSSSDSVEINGVKYYQAGCTTNNTYTNID